MSGGVDSSVAALLLKRQGVDVAGAYMKNWINEDGVVGRCPWEEDIEDARRVADQVGIQFRVVNLMRDYREKVVQYLLDGYAQGLTPNPDVMCNREIKFGVFRAWAIEHGYTAVATGHYARRRGGGRGSSARGGRQEQGPVLLSSPSEPGADRGARFPVGDLEKPELRRLARAAGLATADKKDSQGICFIGEVKMADFLRAYVPDRPGPILRASDGRAWPAPGPALLHARSAPGDRRPLQHRQRALCGRRQARLGQRAPGRLRPSGRARALPERGPGPFAVLDGGPVRPPGPWRAGCATATRACPSTSSPRAAEPPWSGSRKPQRALAAGRCLPFTRARLLGGAVYA